MRSDLFSQASRRQRQRAVAVLVFTVLLSRLPLVLLASGDLAEALRLSGAASGTTRLLPPLWGYIAMPLAWIAKWTGLSPMVFYKLPVMAADAGIAVLLYLMLARLAPDAPLRADEKAPPFWTGGAFWMGLVWAAHPLVLVIGAAAGHSDSVALLAILAAAWFVEFSENPRSDWLAPLALSAALSIKLWPLMMLPLFIKAHAAKRDKWRFALIAMALPLLLVFPMWLGTDGAGRGIVALKNSLTGAENLGLVYGLKTLGLWPGWQTPLLGFALMAPLGCLYLFGPWKFPLLPGLALAALVLLVTAGDAGVQALLWPLPFALMVPGALALRLGFVGLGAALLHFGLSNPEALFLQGRFFSPEVPRWFSAGWGLLNLFLWLFWLKEAWRLLGMCLKPARLRFR